MTYFPSLYISFALQGKASMYRLSPLAGDTPPYEKTKHLPNKGPGPYSFPLVGILSLCWTSLEKSSLCFDADTLQHIQLSSKFSTVLQGESRIQSISYRFIYFPLRDKGIYAKPEALFISAFAHSCSSSDRRRSDTLQCELLSLQTMFCNIQSSPVVLYLDIFSSNQDFEVHKKKKKKPAHYMQIFASLWMVLHGKVLILFYRIPGSSVREEFFLPPPPAQSSPARVRPDHGIHSHTRDTTHCNPLPTARGQPCRAVWGSEQALEQVERQEINFAMFLEIWFFPFYGIQIR